MKAKESILAFAGRQLPVIHADADEPVDMNEADDSPAFNHDLIAHDPSSCCDWIRQAGTGCDGCPFAEQKDCDFD
jgi:hypothetical protein